MPTGLLCNARNSLKATMKHRFESNDPCFETLKQQWISGPCRVFHDLPPLQRQPRTHPTL